MHTGTPAEVDVKQKVTSYSSGEGYKPEMDTEIDCDDYEAVIEVPTQNSGTINTGMIYTTDISMMYFCVFAKMIW